MTTPTNITTHTTLDHVTVWRELPLTGRRPLKVREHANPNATTTYHFTASRAADSITIEPAFADATETIPTQIHIYLGLEPGKADPGENYDALPSINGVTLSGTILSLDPAEIPDRKRPSLHFARACGGNVSTTTENYLNDILTAIINAYTQRPQTETERHTTAVHHAPLRLARLEHDHIRPARAALDHQTDLIENLHQAAANLRHLIDGNPPPATSPSRSPIR